MPKDYISEIDRIYHSKGDPDKPEEKSKSRYKYENPRTGEVFTYVRKGLYKKDGVTLRYKGKTTT
tara:strand:- start:107 stop:301 length:195 start_codon:yes stop_codon:yes gene_type:complete